VKTEYLEDGHQWLRIADPQWKDPLDSAYAQERGGRWNPPASYPTLYFNADADTARANFRVFVEQWPYEPEDLRNDAGPVLVAATLPRRQQVADLHSLVGLAEAGLPTSYPLDENGNSIRHETCQPIGHRAKQAGLKGVLCRSANADRGAGRELAWFPATTRSRARLRALIEFADWFWATEGD
jgi:hypothetical protein